MAESLSLEETNKLRLELGLPALAEDAGDSVNPDQVAYDNYQKIKGEQDREARERETIDRIEKSKNRKKNREKLKGKTIAEDVDDGNALDWIRKMRAKEKKLAEKRARELEQQDEAYTMSKYDASDLTGIKVGHDLTEFNEGNEMILTLKDRGILDDEDGGDDEDELTNIHMEEKEKLQKNQEAKKSKPGYNPYDDDEFVMGGAKKSILPQYEEEAKREGFRIGKHGKVQAQREEENGLSVSEKLKAQTLSYNKMQEIKDYYTQEEQNLKFKKPKSKKKKKLRKREADADQPSSTSSAQPPSDNPGQEGHQDDDSRPAADTHTSFVDDDDLQEALARSRRTALNERRRKLKTMTPEEIARSIAESQAQEEEEEADTGDRLVISETTEFVNSLQSHSVRLDERTRAAGVSRPEHKTELPASSSINVMQIDSGDASEAASDTDEPDTTEDMDTDAAEMDMKPKETDVAVTEEPLVSRGIAATLALLSQKGAIKAPTESQLAKDRERAEQLRWEMEKRQREREREEERERQRGRGRDRGSNRGNDHDRQRERERDKEREEQARMRDHVQRMKDYKPDVNLEYVDESGNQMNTKEAFRFMSHKFHGKTSGKTKTEKRMQKLEEQKKLDTMSSTDTPLNLAGALLERQQRTGHSHVVLSVGNRGVVAPSASLLSSKSAPGDKGKKRSRTSNAGEAENSKRQR